MVKAEKVWVTTEDELLRAVRPREIDDVLIENVDVRKRCVLVTMRLLNADFPGSFYWKTFRLPNTLDGVLIPPSCSLVRDELHKRWEEKF